MVLTINDGVSSRLLVSHAALGHVPASLGLDDARDPRVLYPKSSIGASVITLTDSRPHMVSVTPLEVFHVPCCRLWAHM